MHGRSLFVFLLFFSHAASSQDSIFQIKNYKYRTAGYRALSLNLTLAGSHTSADNNVDPTSIGSYFQLAPSHISYYRIISSDARWHESGISLQPAYSYRKSSTSALLLKEQQFTGQVFWRRTDRFYNASQTYVELGNELQGSRVSVRNESETSVDKRSENSAVDVLTIGLGKGRIEFVQDAQMALFILEDLQRQGLLQRAVDAETCDAFARLLTDINNRRVFDFRRRRIYELSRIDSFLQIKGLLATPGIRSFVTINDNWSLAFNPPRSSGTIYFVKLKPSFRWSTGINKWNTPPTFSERKIDSRTVGLSPVIGFETYKPASLKWQRNAGLSVSFERYWNWWDYTFKSDTDNNKASFYSHEGLYAMNAFYGIGFYPNNRTVLNTSLNLAANYYNKNYWKINPQIQFSTSFFLGYRTRLNADLAYGFNRNSIEFSNGMVSVSRQSALNVSMGLAHSIL